MTALSIVALIVCVSTSWSCRYPDWPGEFKWSFSGPVDGWACTRIPEPADPNKWTDNYFCHKSLPGIVGVGMRWSYAGNSIANGKRCSKKFCKIHRKTPPMTFLFNKVGGLGFMQTSEDIFL